MLIFGPRPNDDSYGAANPSLGFKLTIARHNKRVAVLYGLAGVGKTTTVKSYLIDYSNTFTFVFWIDATNQASIEESYAAILQKVQPSKMAGKDVATEVLDLLTGVGRWAVVFDGAPGTEIDARFVQMARSHQGMIFITTRNAFGQFKDKFEVGPVEEVQAIQELLAYVNSMDEESARLIVRELEGYGLALMNAAIYVVTQGISLHEYLDLLHDNKAKLLQWKPGPSLASVKDVIGGQLEALRLQNPQAFEWLEDYACLTAEERATLEAQGIDKDCSNVVLESLYCKSLVVLRDDGWHVSSPLIVEVIRLL